MFGSIVAGVVSFCGTLSRTAVRCAVVVKDSACKAAAFVVGGFVTAKASFAQSGPTLPDLGIDPADYIPLASAAVAAIALVAIGYKIGWKVLFRGLGWIGRALSPR